MEVYDVCTLEGDATGEFEAAGAGAFGGLQRRDGAKAGGIGLHIGGLVVAVIEDVGGFNAELDLDDLQSAKFFIKEREKLAVPGPTTPPTGALPKRPMPLPAGVCSLR